MSSQSWVPSKGLQTRTGLSRGSSGTKARISASAQRTPALIGGAAEAQRALLVQPAVAAALLKGEERRLTLGGVAAVRHAGGPVAQAREPAWQHVAAAARRRELHSVTGCWSSPAGRAGARRPREASATTQRSARQQDDAAPHPPTGARFSNGCRAAAGGRAVAAPPPPPPPHVAGDPAARICCCCCGGSLLLLLRLLLARKLEHEFELRARRRSLRPREQRDGLQAAEGAGGGGPGRCLRRRSLLRGIGRPCSAPAPAPAGRGGWRRSAPPGCWRAPHPARAGRQGQPGAP